MSQAIFLNRGTQILVDLFQPYNAQCGIWLVKLFMDQSAHISDLMTCFAFFCFQPDPFFNQLHFFFLFHFPSFHKRGYKYSSTVLREDDAKSLRIHLSILFLLLLSSFLLLVLAPPPSPPPTPPLAHAIFSSCQPSPILCLCPHLTLLGLNSCLCPFGSGTAGTEAESR